MVLFRFDPTRWAYKGYYHAVVAIVRIDPEIVNRPIDGGWTLLYAAASGDHPEIVEFLIESGANPDLSTGRSENDCPVHAAAEGGSSAAMKLLAEAGADLDASGGSLGAPPIMLAADDGHLEVVRVLLDAGMDPNSNDWYRPRDNPEILTGFTTLERAAMHGHSDVVKLLIERGAKVKYTQDGHQTSALHTFVFMPPLRDFHRYEHWMRNMPTVLDLLVKELGDVNYRAGGFTPLHEAVGSGQRESLPIVRHLVENYPELEVNATDGFGETPLHHAMRHDSQLPAIEYLVENCPDLDVNSTDEFQHTPLHEGARSGNAAAVKYLLENCPTVKVNATNQWGFTPLNRASEALGEAKQMKNQEKVQAINQIIELLKAHGGKYGEYRI